MKDYEKPYFKEYLKLCSEIEMLPASEQETKVITMFHEFYKTMADSVELSSGLAARMIAKTASIAAERDALRDEIDRYDKICTGVRNELTAAGIPELTEDRLMVVPLVKRTHNLVISRNAWKKLAELFAEHWTVNLLGCHCIHCHKEQVWNMAGNTWKQTHSPNCPIEQLRKMKEGEG